MAPLYILFAIVGTCFVFAWIAKRLGFMEGDEEILKEHRNKKIK